MLFCAERSLRTILRTRAGHSCLMSGTGEAGRTIHVVCTPKPEYLAIITAYVPETDEWDSEFRIRRPS